MLPPVSSWQLLLVEIECRREPHRMAPLSETPSLESTVAAHKSEEFETCSSLKRVQSTVKSWSPLLAEVEVVESRREVLSSQGQSQMVGVPVPDLSRLGWECSLPPVPSWQPLLAGIECWIRCCSVACCCWSCAAFEFAFETEVEN